MSDHYLGGLVVGAQSVAIVGGGAVLPPLTIDRTVYVNSATGSDVTGDGSVGLPWQTLAHAWADRLAYGELRAKYTIQLLGVGPYTMPVMGASVCGVGGFFVLQGDPAVDVAVASGTFTGDIVTSTTMAIPTSAGLGSDTLKAAFLEITSGNCNGVRCSINNNTDTSIVVSYAPWRATLGAIANGDTFRVWSPGTVVNCNTVASGQEASGIVNWHGARNVSVSGGDMDARHYIYNLVLGSTGFPKIRYSEVALVAVVQTGTGGLNIWNSYVGAMGSVNGFVLGIGADAATNKAAGLGLNLVGSGSCSFGGHTKFFGVFYCVGNLTVGSGSPNDHFVLYGGRLAGTTFVNSYSRMELGGSGAVRIEKSLTLSCGHLTAALFGGFLNFAVSVASALILNKGATARLEGNSRITGGTTDAAGFAIQLGLLGGRVFLGGAPLMTGGTPGADIKTTTLVKPNAFFAAAGDYISDMGGGEIVARG